MENILKDIKQNCRECETTRQIVKFLHSRGDFSYHSEYHREIWFFYKEALTKIFKNSKYPKREAREHTINMMKISPQTFRRIREKYQDRI